VRMVSRKMERCSRDGQRPVACPGGSGEEKEMVERDRGALLGRNGHGRGVI
jgi:hypothetical protein